jgi:hypothetical protein
MPAEIRRWGLRVEQAVSPADCETLGTDAFAPAVGSKAGAVLEAVSERRGFSPGTWKLSRQQQCARYDIHGW